MTDYHDNETEYTYTDRNQLSTLTAPGSKTWSFDYNELGQPTDYDIPNGMTCEYGYDTRNRLTAIEYKDGSTVLDGFYYEMDDTGNITKTTDELGGYWDYQYDDRYRLTDAILTHDAGVRWSEEYTYDDGDNMLTKKQPWSDLFNSGIIDGTWTTSGGNWSVANDALSCSYTGGSNQWVRRDQAEDDVYLWFSYKGTTSYTGTGLDAWVRRSSNGANKVVVGFKTDGTAEIKEANGGGTSVLQSCSTPYANGTWYDVCIKVDGTDIEVWKGPRGGALTQIMTYSSLAVTASDTLFFQVGFWGSFDLDDMAVVKADGDPVETVTFAVNNANELSTMTDPNGTTTFGFDDWGRMTSKARGAFSVEYGYKYEDLLVSIESDFPGGGAVEYEYNGAGMRRERTVASAITKFKWAEYSLINEENAAGTLTASHIADGLGFVSGSDPATGSSRYYTFDHLGSTSQFRAQNKASVAQYGYGPYGTQFMGLGEDVLRRYTDHLWDPVAGLYYTPYRQLAPDLSRWLVPDPMHMIQGTNMYLYVLANPILYRDPLGLLTDGQLDSIQAGLSLCGLIPGIGEFCDLTNAAVSLGRGNYEDAALNCAAAIPGLGVLATGAKCARKGTAAATRASNVNKGVPESALGPSGKPKIHGVDHATRKRSKDGARRDAGKSGTTVEHASPKRGNPHHHGQTQSGTKKRTHHNYPRR